MALTQVAGDFGEALRVTDSVGGCISYGQSPTGTDPDFLGPQMSILFRFAKINSGNGVGRCSAGFSDEGGVDERAWLEVEANTPDTSSMRIMAKLNTTACGAVTVHSYDMPKDTSWHSVAWTYDEAGDSVLYLDGAEVDSDTAPCSDISGPVDAGQVFTVWGSHTPGLEIFYVDNGAYSDEIVPAAQVQDIHDNGMAGD